MTDPGAGGSASLPNAKAWGRRAYAGKVARELMNDISRAINREQPSDVDDPSDPSLADVLRHADVAAAASGDAKAVTLTELMAHDLDFQEAVCWYWFAHCQFDITEVHYAMTGTDQGGDPQQRRNNVRNVVRVLKSAAEKLPDADPDAIPGMVDSRKRHDRTTDPSPDAGSDNT